MRNALNTREVSDAIASDGSANEGAGQTDSGLKEDLDRLLEHAGGGPFTLS